MCTYFTWVFGHTLTKCYYDDPEVFPLIRRKEQSLIYCYTVSLHLLLPPNFLGYLKEQLLSLTKPATNKLYPNIINDAIVFTVQTSLATQNYHYLNYDVDLHVIEPDGTRVYWDNMQGAAGFQDSKEYY